MGHEEAIHGKRLARERLVRRAMPGRRRGEPGPQRGTGAGKPAGGPGTALRAAVPHGRAKKSAPATIFLETLSIPAIFQHRINRLHLNLIF